MRAMYLRWLAIISLLSWLAACGSATPGPAVPGGPAADLPAAFEAAARQETQQAALGTPFLDAIDRAVGRPDDPWALATVFASLDALATRQLEELDASLGQAIAFRSRSTLVEVVGRLHKSWQLASQAARAHRGAERPSTAPLMAGAIASTLHDLAMRLGDADAAARWRRRAGCATTATVAGPVAWPPLLGLDQTPALAFRDELPRELAGVPPFAERAPLLPVVADGCELDVNATSALRGVRIVVIDIDNPQAQWLTFAVRSSSAVRVELGGQPLLSRPYAAGGSQVTRLARARVAKGRARLVARVAQNLEGGGLTVSAWAADGRPLRLLAPQARERANASASAVEALAVAPVDPKPSTEQLVLATAALLALGEARQAAELFDRPGAPPPAESEPLVDLLRVRATQAAGAAPRTQLLTRVQAAAERAYDNCKTCWEARIVRAAVKQERRGQGVGTFAALKDLGVHPDSSAWTQELGPMELAYVATLARRAGLLDLVRQSYDALDEQAAGSLLLADVDALVHRRTGGEAVRAACGGGTSRAGSRCLLAHIARGDLASTRAEIQRQRQLRGSPDVLRETELGQLLAHGKLDEALGVYSAMLPAKRTLAVLGAALRRRAPDGRTPADDPRHEQARQWFARDMLRARDAPHAYEPLARLLGVSEDHAARLEREGLDLVAQDRSDAFLPGAGTAVLRHTERYRLEPSGLLHFWMHDLRRVSGTQDVASGIWSGAPTIDGRSTSRTLRHRIHKRDGRVLDPDPTATGAQGHTELSQLEAGDYVESITEGWALPDDSGQLVVDTSDLLPMRTSVREAEIELTRPETLELALWSHQLLGEGATRRHAGRATTVWRVSNQPPRRIEEGVPVMEARVGISFGTDTYERIARSIGERLRALDEDDGFMTQWMRAVVGDEPMPPKKQLARIVAAVGKEVRKADPDALSDFVASLGGGPQRETARHILERGRGSRSWVVHRALRELGLKSRIAVSETRPFSASPHFPPHVGRFRHPLVVADIGSERVWIDADVEGPPLPPGRVSPELRGRQALLVSGEMLTVAGVSGFESDEIDIRLVVDEQGDARGTFTALIHGRPAQRLADAFETEVGSARDRLLRNVVLGWVPWADVRETTLSSEEGSWQVALRAGIHIAGFARPEGRDRKTWSLPGILPVHAVYPRPSATTLGARYAAQAGRTSALAISEPLWFHVHRRIELPADSKVTRLAEALAVHSEYLQARRSVTQKGQVIEEDFHLNLPVGTVPLEAFERFLADVRSVDDGFRYGTLVRASRQGRRTP